MMSLNVRAKSTVLAIAMVVSTNSFCVGLTNPMPKIGSLIVAHKGAALSMVALAGFIGKVCLDTKPRVQYFYDNWQQDVTDLLNAYNVLDAQNRATIQAFFGKYFVGAKFKKEETTTRTKNDDGAVVTLKGCKVVQKPSGLVGLVDAYVLMQMEGLAKLIPGLATLYAAIYFPEIILANSANKALDVKAPTTATTTPILTTNC